MVQDIPQTEANVGHKTDLTQTLKVLNLRKTHMKTSTGIIWQQSKVTPNHSTGKRPGQPVTRKASRSRCSDWNVHTQYVEQKDGKALQQLD